MAEPHGGSGPTSDETSPGSTYRHHVRRAVSASAAPYGYTLTLWTTGAITMHAQGLPSTMEAILLLFGAILAFTAVGAAAFGSINQAFAPTTGGRTRIWAGIHIPSVGLSVLLCSLLVHNFTGWLLWPVVGFTATTTYLIGLAAQFWIASRPGKHANGDDDAQAAQPAPDPTDR